jgi:hypothetical protein
MRDRGVNFKHEFIFIHVPKTAGRSVHSSLLDAFNMEYSWPDNNLGGHVSSVNYQSRYKEEYDKFFKFAFVRNPWDRLVSAFFYMSNHYIRPQCPFLKRERPHESFETFIKEDLPRFLLHTHVRPQSFWVCDEDGEVNVDFVGRFESLNEDFKNVCNKLNAGNQKLKFTNRHDSRKNGHGAGSSKPYWEFYDKQMVDIVGDLFFQDVKTFGYNFR